MYVIYRYSFIGVLCIIGGLWLLHVWDRDKDQDTCIEGLAATNPTPTPPIVGKSVCNTDCGQFVSMQSSYNDLKKAVNEVFMQRDHIEKNQKRLDALSDKMKNMNSDRTPNGPPQVTPANLR